MGGGLLGWRYCSVGMGSKWYSGCVDSAEGEGAGLAVWDSGPPHCRGRPLPCAARRILPRGPSCALGAYLALCFVFSRAFSAGGRSLRLSLPYQQRAFGKQQAFFQTLAEARRAPKNSSILAKYHLLLRHRLLC